MLAGLNFNSSRNDGLVRLLEKIEDVHLLGVERISKLVATKLQMSREQKNVSDVDCYARLRMRAPAQSRAHGPAVTKWPYSLI
jgi:hypothetical protein